MALTAPTLDNLTLDLKEEIHVRASLDATFEALLEQMGPGNTGVGGVPMPMVLEARPGDEVDPRRPTCTHEWQLSRVAMDRRPPPR